MGGKKKLSTKQMKRRQKESGEQMRKKKDKAAGLREKNPLGIVAPDPKDKGTLSELRKMSILTPYIVASRFNVRISIAKDFLDQLEEHGEVQMVCGNHNLKIYRPVG